jgi:hypothetical protein
MTDFQEGIGPDTYDAVDAAMGIDDNPPEGLVFHWVGNVDGKWTVTDVWESPEASTRFRSERLFPAIQQATGMDPAAGPQPTITVASIHNYVKP